jgi:hypothetical protein
MDRWAWSHLTPWLELRTILPVRLARPMRPCCGELSGLPSRMGQRVDGRCESSPRSDYRVPGCRQDGGARCTQPLWIPPAISARR